MDDIVNNFLDQNSVPYVCLYDQLDRAFSTLQVDNMKAVAHEDDEFNEDFSVDPLADPRLDKMDLFNMVDTKDRDAVMSANSSYVSAGSDFVPSPAAESTESSSSDSGSGE